MKKKILSSVLLSSCVLGAALFIGSDSASAHGYVETPPARGYTGSLEKDTLGWTEAFNKYGNVITNPQSLEAPKGFPTNGPVDGRIASANGGSGQINDFVLDEQGSDRWNKSDINTGTNTFTWKYTATHKTTKWHYYMTKPGWDQNAPLNRDELELIGTVDHDGSVSTNNLSHTLNIPDDRMGYHVILAVWDVDDTPNAFYNAIDVNVNNSVIPTAPTKPTNVKSSNVTKNAASLSWDAQTTASSYNVYRNGEKIKTVNGNQFDDSNLKANTEYKYEIEAVSPSGQVSPKSSAVSVKTLAEDVKEKPSAPTSLHSMGETETTVSLMWNKSIQSSGIKKYEIYRDNKLVGETDKTSFEDTGLTAGKSYSYKVKAISVDGQTSDFSNELKVSTKSDETITNPEGYRQFKLGTLTNPELYTAGEIVVYKGKYYKTLSTHNNYGDATWAPDKAASLFVEIDAPETQEPEFKPELKTVNHGLMEPVFSKNNITLQFSDYNRVIPNAVKYDFYRDGEKIGYLNGLGSTPRSYDLNGNLTASYNKSQPRLRDENIEKGKTYTYQLVALDSNGKEIAKSEAYEATNNK